jgi:hypothetical protein
LHLLREPFAGSRVASGVLPSASHFVRGLPSIASLSQAFSQLFQTIASAALKDWLCRFATTQLRV